MADLLRNLSDSITTAISLCAEVKKTRHVGKSHTQLDLLEASFAFGPDSLNLSSSISLSEAGSKELQGYLSQMTSINSRLEHLAHPKKHGHAHHHHHEMQDPHFGEIRGVWEKVRDGVEKLLAGKGGGEEVTKKVEVTLQVKEETKEETKKEEVKIEVKEEQKQEVNPQVKQEAKEEPQEEAVKLEAKHEAEIKIEEVVQVNA